MSHTDKDNPFWVRQVRDEVGHSGNWGAGDSGYRHTRRYWKRQGSKAARRGKTSFWATKTVLSEIANH